MAFRLTLVISILWAQGVDIAKYRVDPATFLFEDGRTTLTDYVTAQLQSHSTCCGIDGIYVELRITPEGTLESVRPMTGRNDCYKKSVVDILRPLRWKAEGFQGTRTVYYEFRFSLECKGTESDNVYKPIPAPGAPVASAPPQKSEGPKPTETAQAPETPVPAPSKKEEPKPAPSDAQEPGVKPIPPTPPLPGQTEPKTSEETPMAEAPKPQPAPKPKPAPAQPTPPAQPKAPAEPPKRVSQPGPPPPPSPGEPRPPAVVGPLPTDTVPKPLQVQIPKQYQSTGEKRPPDQHLGSHLNTTGPRYMEPDYINGPVAKALYLKKAYRDNNVCGLVHVLLEIAIDRNGQVRGYRILAANSPKVAEVTPKVLQGLRYKPVPLPMVFYTEFKIDVDCQSDQRRYQLDSIPDYLATPEGKLIRPATPKP
jgi:hypothetical protein